MSEEILRSVTIRISEELFKEMKHCTVEDNLSVKDYLTNLIENDIKRRKK